MLNNKSLGPDRFICEVFKASWSIIGIDFIVAIHSFFVKGFFTEGTQFHDFGFDPEEGKSHWKERLSANLVMQCDV